MMDSEMKKGKDGPMRYTLMRVIDHAVRCRLCFLEGRNLRGEGVSKEVRIRDLCR